ncbi:O-antigen ligase [Thermosulfurimonas sp. F29]|uniref:O-antigen ligase family protein n=1 Tax=Thermosulfurimonas sp. F29 TaxID=2867247 RepID=UPI001C837658|nr:O-antigen ligase family protein [Thermosulfurimonas sp. F29]MBX6422825.1 O-antigen ligase family protein [Thermosulfurimonas sp. F29]
MLLRFEFRKFFALFFFVLGYSSLWISLFFKHTRGLLYGGHIALLLSFLLFYSEIKSILYSDKKLVFLQTIFLLALLIAVAYSPYPEASLDAFLLNYFFHISLFFLIYGLISRFSSFIILDAIWIIPLIINLFVCLFCLVKSLKICSLKWKCLFTIGINFIGPNLLKGLVSTSTVFVLCFFYFVSLGINFKGFKRYLSLIVSFMDFAFILWFGRRAAILGIILGSFLVALYHPSRKFSNYILYLTILITTLIVVISFSYYGRSIFIRSDKIFLLLSSRYENWPQAGSLGQRFYIWPLYFKEALSHPFRGTGLARRVQKRVLRELNRKALNLEHAHNLFLNLWLQAGIQAVIPLVIFYFWTLRKALKLVQIKHHLGTALFAFLIAFLVMSCFEGLEELTRFTPFWIGSGLVWGYAARASSTSSG